jgi:hypothetical protein
MDPSGRVRQGAPQERRALPDLPDVQSARMVKTDARAVLFGGRRGPLTGRTQRNRWVLTMPPFRAGGIGRGAGGRDASLWLGAERGLNTLTRKPADPFSHSPAPPLSSP